MESSKKMTGYCTGCGFRINPGPQFVRRVKRHLNDGRHNHDAIEMQPYLIGGVVLDTHLTKGYRSIDLRTEMD